MARVWVSRLIALAKALVAATKSKNTKLTDLPPLETTLTAAEKHVADLAVLAENACVALNAGCFAAGTKLRTPNGWMAVETIEVGQLVLARHEDEAHGETAWKAVEAKFDRTGRILHLHVNGQLIRTTPEHPFFVFGKAWTAAGALAAGDWISTEAGGWAAVEETFDTGEYETVYNVRVAEYHTYFVGDEEWESGVWAHNAYKTVTQTVPGAAGSFTVTAAVVSGTESQTYPNVRQITSISGPLQKSPSSTLGKSQMRDNLLNSNPTLASSYQAGHLIASSLGGPANTWNLVPMTSAFNQKGGWKSMEKRIQAFLESSDFQSASMQVSLTYPTSGTTFIPTKIVVVLTFNGIKKSPLVFTNLTTQDPRNFADSAFLATTWP